MRLGREDAIVEAAVRLGGILEVERWWKWWWGGRVVADMWLELGTLGFLESGEVSNSSPRSIYHSCFRALSGTSESIGRALRVITLVKPWLNVQLETHGLPTQ